MEERKDVNGLKDGKACLRIEVRQVCKSERQGKGKNETLAAGLVEVSQGFVKNEICMFHYSNGRRTRGGLVKENLRT